MLQIRYDATGARLPAYGRAARTTVYRGRKRTALLFARHLAVFCLALTFAAGSPALADDAVLMPANIIFVTSTGYWEESGDPLGVLDPNGAKTAENQPAAQSPAPARRGYYKLVAVRQPEGNTHVFLQQVALDASGPKIVSSAELEEFSAMKAYVTDIRPETSDGVASQPGLFATVYLKTDPAAGELETWTVLIDDIGDIKVERETN
ncbi:hypothetical protein OE766_03805 [Pararhizobium sp. YC-54]|uniref:hypothetical protein n=1 Tax=Pararhizobium sp. YC-54 TaxID=2986920 RepID=UPI0021F73FD2|nr:hypothetical protein [Pararhizobium sp. YC-54]MCV9997363.1 hypothetical protein [Pararhizobium sp. YC-54]